jgi:3-isopropylmalate/(R)-2-methylmalate dehydratase large subunit
LLNSSTGPFMGQTLYNKIFALHTVSELSSGFYQLFVGLHLLHEVTSPQAFSRLEQRQLKVKYPHRNFATIDHIIPTHSQERPASDPLAEKMMHTLEKNVVKHGLKFFAPLSGEQGIVHVIGPEKGLTHPGMTICCGDSHTSTHGAFGTIAFGVGTTQIGDILATQTVAVSKLKVRRIEINGTLPSRVYAKDVIVHIIRQLGAKGGVGYAYEYAGEVIDAMSMEKRMTLCNMSIEGGARCGYVNPDQKTYDYLWGREFAPSENVWSKALAYWESLKSDPDAEYDDLIVLKGEEIAPMVTWGISPDQGISIFEKIPDPAQFPPSERDFLEETYRYMGFQPGQPIRGTPIDVAFIGSCANSRFSDFEEVVRLVELSGLKVAPRVKALIVPGSERVRREIIEHGYDQILLRAGFEFRQPGCSLCVGINPDALKGNQTCASSSTRNFKGRQGSPNGRTLLMSPVMVAAAALAGEVIHPDAL